MYMELAVRVKPTCILARLSKGCTNRWIWFELGGIPGIPERDIQFLIA